MASVTEAEKELTQAIAVEFDISSELSDLESRVAEVERTVGDRCLTARKEGDAKLIQRINDELQKLKNQRDVLLKTLDAARTAIVNGKHALNLAKARVLRDEAAKLGKEANGRQAITNDLLSQLFEFEGVHYQQEAMTRGGACLPGRFAETKTAKLAMEARALVQQAETLENQVCRVESDPPVGGRVSGAVII